MMELNFLKNESKRIRVILMLDIITYSAMREIDAIGNEIKKLL